MMLWNSLLRTCTAAILLLTVLGCAGGDAVVPDPAAASAELQVIGEEAGIQWLRQFEAPVAAPRTRDKMFLLYFTLKHCDPCEMMRKWTFADERVVRASEDFVPVEIWGDIELQSVRRFDIQSYPTIVFFDLEKGEIDRKAGFRDADFLLEWMKEVKSNETTIAALEERLRRNPDDIEALLGQGYNLLDVDRIEQALELAEKAKALSPQDAGPLALLGMCRMRTGEFEMAEAAADAALEADGHNEKARHLKTAILLNRADEELKNGNGETALKWFLEVLEIDPKNFDGLIGSGRAFTVLGRGPDALRKFNETIDVRPESPLPHDAIGSYYAEKGEDAAAEIEFLKAIEVEPRYESPYFRLVELYEKQGRRDKMIEMYERVLSFSPASAHNEIAWLMATSKHPNILDPDAAIKHATMAVELDPRPWYIDTLAEAYYAAGRYDAAIALIKEAMVKESDDSQYYEDQLRKFEEARDNTSAENGKED